MEDPELYRSLIGRLLYLNFSRPNIPFSIQQLSQFMSVPRKPLLLDAVHVVKYVKSTWSYRSFYLKEGGNDFVTHCDADWGTSSFLEKVPH